MDDLFFANGIDMETGEYVVPPLSTDDLDAILRKEQSAENLSQLEARIRQTAHLGLKAGLDPKDLGEAGWGIVFPDQIDPAIETALAPLTQLRQEQAGPLFKRMVYKVGTDNKGKFLARYGGGPGTVEPELVPYYLMLVGSPEKTPYQVQNQLDVDYAVGRIDFDTPEEYGRYAQSVISAEQGQVSAGRRLGFFDPGRELAEPGAPQASSRRVDAATSQSAQYLVTPLLRRLAGRAGWQIDEARGDAASKAHLASWLGEGERQALLFAACHGLEVSRANSMHRRQQDYQGALVCADWPGPGSPLTDEGYFFAGKDVRDDADLRGTIAMFFACFGAGTPRLDQFGRLLQMKRGQQAGAPATLTEKPFVAALPKRLLAAPAGGALAVVGHVERAWPSSFVWMRKEDGTLPPQTATFESVITSLMDGVPVGAAVEHLNVRYASLAVALKDLLEAVELEFPYDRVELANTWMACNDAQGYIVIGDPAVRLPVGTMSEGR